MEDADLEEIRAKRLAQLQSEYKVNYEFIWSSFFFFLLKFGVRMNTKHTFFITIICIRRKLKIGGKITSCINVSQSVSAFLSVLFNHAVSCLYCIALMIEEWLGKGAVVEH